MVSCEDDSCPRSVRAICCKGDNVWKIEIARAPTHATKFKMLMMVEGLIQRS